MLFEKNTSQKKMEIFSFAAILSTDSHHLFHSEPTCPDLDKRYRSLHPVAVHAPDQVNILCS